MRQIPPCGTSSPTIAEAATLTNLANDAIVGLKSGSPQLRGTSNMSEEDLKAELERLKAENEQLKTERARGTTLKVSEKGGVSVYGMGRFPITLYKEQWTKLLDMADEIRAFIRDNDAKLKTKSEA
jgi:uncharacterized phage infection (PIP) family protein YhgE